MNKTPTRASLATEKDRRMALAHLRGVEAALIDHDREDALANLRCLQHTIYNYYINSTISEKDRDTTTNKED